MSWFHIVDIVLFARAAWVAVAHCGIVGYGYGEMAVLLSRPLIHRSVHNAIGSRRYGISAPRRTSVAIGLFWRQLGTWTITVRIVALLCPPSPRQPKYKRGMFAGSRRHAI
jgi:hypothetical protein